MSDDALNRGCCNSQNTVAVMSVRESHLHEPESCICPICKRVMRLSRVPALKELDTTEFYFRCDGCDYTSAQLTEISGELVCDIRQEADFRPTASALITCCEREIAILVRASGATSEDRLPRAAQLPPIPGLLPVGANHAIPTRGSIDPDQPVPAPMLQRSGYASSGVTTFRVASGIAAALVGCSVVAIHSAGAPKPPSSETRLVTLLPLAQAVPSSIELHNNANPVLNAQDVGAASERETQFVAAGDMATAGLPPTHVAKADDVATAAVNHAGFVFAESNVRYLSRAELENLSADQLHIAHNEILARRGRFFNDHRLSAHFAKFAWYQPSARHVRLNLIEQANVGLIMSIEGSPYHAQRRQLAAPDLDERGNAFTFTREKPQGSPARTSDAAEVGSIHKD
jgi:hypothetical protein